MKNLTILVALLINTSFSRSIDSMGVFPFGPELDLREALTVEDVIKVFGTPNSINTSKSDIYVRYPNKMCYFYGGKKLYSIEVIKGEFQDFEVSCG